MGLRLNLVPLLLQRDRQLILVNLTQEFLVSDRRLIAQAKPPPIVQLRRIHHHTMAVQLRLRLPTGGMGKHRRCDISCRHLCPPGLG